jgi:hypothetical protein
LSVNPTTSTVSARTAIRSLTRAPSAPAGSEISADVRAVSDTTAEPSPSVRQADPCLVRRSKRFQTSRSLLAKADPELLRYIYGAFQFTVELDRNTPEIRMKALVSSAFSVASDLDSIAATVAHKDIAGERGERFVLIGELSVTVERVAPWPGS